jgi:hypothetical protein
MVIKVASAPDRLYRNGHGLNLNVTKVEIMNVNNMYV